MFREILRNAEGRYVTLTLHGSGVLVAGVLKRLDASDDSDADYPSIAVLQESDGDITYVALGNVVAVTVRRRGDA